MVTALKWIEVASASLFALWALYVSLVEHPARMSAGTGAALAQWRPSYARAAPWQASAAAVSVLSGAVTSLLTREWQWGAGGLLIGLAIPFTIVAILPLNRRLHDPKLSPDEARPLLAHWGRLHGVRTLLGLLGLLVLIVEIHR
jgi:Domain of unknown function (DUF1772)